MRNKKLFIVSLFIVYITGITYLEVITIDTGLNPIAYLYYIISNVVYLLFTKMPIIVPKPAVLLIICELSLIAVYANILLKEMKQKEVSNDNTKLLIGLIVAIITLVILIIIQINNKYLMRTYAELEFINEMWIRNYLRS